MTLPFVEYPDATGTGPFSVPFTYRRQADVAAYMKETPEVPVEIEWASASTVTTPVARDGSDTLVIYRSTPISSPVVEFQRGSVSAHDLNDQVLQLRLRIEESVDLLTALAAIAAKDGAEQAQALAELAAEAAAASALLVDGPAIAASIDSRVPKTTTGSDFTQPESIVQNLMFLQAGTGAVSRSLRAKLRELPVSVRDFGAVGDGVTNDAVAIQKAIDAAGVNGLVLFPKTTANIYLVNTELSFYSGQRWEGVGGTNVLAGGTRIRLGAAASGVASGKDKLTNTTFGWSCANLLFDAMGFGDYGISLYNCSYSNLFQPAGICTKAGASAVLMDANVTDKCYFNILHQPRLFSSGTTPASAVKFTRGANRNIILGGRIGGSTRGLTFDTDSADNIIIGTDFEENTECHVYMDAPGNKFFGCGMENAPIGYLATANAEGWCEFGTSFATSVTTQIQNAAKNSTGHGITREASVTVGYLNMGPVKNRATYLTTSSNTTHDINTFDATCTVTERSWLNMNTAGLVQQIFHRANGTSQVAVAWDSTGVMTHGDLYQQAGVGSGTYRYLGLRSGQPGSGLGVDGDYYRNSGPVVGGAVGWAKVGGAYVPIAYIPGVTSVGNAAATLTPGTSAPTQRWNSPLTADRAVTLAAGDNGAKFRIVRTAAATGAFNLDVGTGPLKSLTPGTWCDVEFNGSSWFLTASGTL